MKVSENLNGNRLSQDWHWQVKHTVKDIPTVERLLGIKFSQEKRQQLEQTLEKFPMRITPYYLSLINGEDYENDPIFRQSVPSIHELNIEKYDIRTHWRKTKTARQPA